MLMVLMVLLVLCCSAAAGVGDGAATSSLLDTIQPFSACMQYAIEFLPCVTPPRVANALRLQLHGKANQVINKGVAGSTSLFWSQNIDVMLALIAAAGPPEYLWLSIGGDDILGYCSQGMCAGGNTAEVNARILNSTSAMLNAIIGAFPTIQIVHFGYDFTNMIQSAECIAMGLALFPNVTDGQGGINEIFLSHYDNVIMPLSVSYGLWYTRVFMYGYLQSVGGAAAGIPPPYPNVAYPSPASLMDDGCIHASAAGWLDLMSQLYNLYFSSRL